MLHLGQELGKHRDEMLRELGAVVRENFLFPGTYHLQRQGQPEQHEFHQTCLTSRATRRPSWLHSVLPAPALLTPDGQTLTAPPPGRLVLPQ